MKMLVVCVALSTALMPFTLVEPPANELMLSQPGRSGTQLTVGMMTAVLLPCAVGTRGRINGMALALSTDLACALSAELAEICAVDGVENGPVSRWQPLAQPVAADPVKVGKNVPRLDEVTVLVVAATRADAAPEEKTASASGSDNSESRVTVLRTRLFLIRCM